MQKGFGLFGQLDTRKAIVCGLSGHLDNCENGLGETKQCRDPLSACIKTIAGWRRNRESTRSRWHEPRLIPTRHEGCRSRGSKTQLNSRVDELCGLVSLLGAEPKVVVRNPMDAMEIIDDRPGP